MKYSNNKINMEDNSNQQQQLGSQSVMESKNSESNGQEGSENHSPKSLVGVAGNVVMRDKRKRRPENTISHVLADVTNVNVPSNIEGQQQSLENMQIISSSDETVLKKKLEDRVLIIGRPLSFISRRPTFAEMVEKSNILADKSMFIKFLFELCRKKRGVFFALPSGSGKTMLLTMLEQFVNIDKKESKIFIGNEEAKKEIKLFDMEFAGSKKFAIMEENSFVADYMHKFPTLLLSLKNIGQFSAKSVEKVYNQFIKNLFFNEEGDKIRDWMDEQLSLDEMDKNTKRKLEKYIRQFDKYLHDEMKIEDWPSAVDFFIELLHFRSTKIGNADGKEKVIVLIDNADSALVNFGYDPTKCANYGRELELVISKTQTFLDCFVEAKNVEMFVFMGNFEIALNKSFDFTIFSLDRDLSEQSEIDLAQYFGFTQTEMKQFCKSYNVSDGIEKESARYYNGLTLCSVPLFSINSAMQMLDEAQWCRADKDKALRIHLVPSNFFLQFHKLFTIDAFTKEINRLFKKGKWICSSANSKITASDVSSLLTYIHSPNDSPFNCPNLADIFMRFLNVSGYLIRRGNELTIPNEEYKMLLTDLKLQKCYQQKWGFDIKEVAGKISTVLLSILLKECEENAKEILAETIFKAFRTKGVIKKIGDTNEVVAQTIIGCSALLIRYWDRNRLDKAMLLGGKNSQRRPDIAVVSCAKKFGLVMELKWDAEPAEEAMGQIAYRGYLSDSCINEEQKHIDHIVVIGVAVYSNKLFPDEDQDEDEVDIDSAVQVIIEKCDRQKKDGQKFVENFRDDLQKRYPKPKDKKKN